MISVIGSITEHAMDRVLYATDGFCLIQEWRKERIIWN